MASALGAEKLQSGLALRKRLQMFKLCKYECRLYVVGLIFILSIVPLGMDDIFSSGERHKTDW